MIALGLLAKDSALRSEVVPEIAKASALGTAKIVAVNGRFGFEKTFIWGEIARQLEKVNEFSKFWRDGAKAPSESDWISLIDDEPTLILMDERPPYFDYAVTRPRQARHNFFGVKFGYRDPQLRLEPISSSER